MDHIQIINIALSNIGAQNIQQIDEGSNESTAAKVFYDPTRRTVLQKLKPTFATKTDRLARTTEQPTDWTYAYELPSDNLEVVNIVNETESYDANGNVNPFEIRGTKLLCDLEVVNILYVYDNEETNMFSDMFIDAFAHLLASKMAMRLTKDRDLQITEFEFYNNIVSEAGASDHNQKKSPKEENPYVDARN